jgi:EpsI family protein
MYMMRDKYIAGMKNISLWKRFAGGNLPIWNASLLAIGLLLAAGISYRTLMSFTTNNVINLPVALSNLPLEIGNWRGSELEIPAITREYMEKNFADDYISRRYINNQSGTWADIYVVYCSSRPGAMVAHQPLICYPGNGWIHDSTNKTQFTIQNGRNIDCQIHRFHKPAPASYQTVVLNFFIVNGNPTDNQKDFNRIIGRNFNFTRNPARYAAQVQISSISESAIVSAAADMTQTILNFLPNQDGKVVEVEQFGGNSAFEVKK